jgi:SAM-dependent methyltransferase/glycosyltransferase involved in cell wall biosynthesis
MDDQELSNFYNAYYYNHSCGVPWKDEQTWQAFFAEIASQIVNQIRPSTVLDVGCGLGLLVHLLRERGIEAYGIDISEYAIQNAYPQARPFCRLGSITNLESFAAPFPPSYDLIVCIEVLEHLLPAQTESAVAILCQHTKDILFSSSPTDYKEATHLNVQPPEVWASLFARHNFYRDADFDASFISHWAIRFCYMEEPFERIVRQYERKFFPLWKENTDLRLQGLEMQQKLAYDEQIIQELTTQLEAQTLSTAVSSAQDTHPGPSSISKDISSPRRRILVISQDIIGPRMAGPGIRYYSLARVLSQEFDVTLAMPCPPDPALENPFLHLVHYQLDSWQTIYTLIQEADVLLTSDHLIALHTDFYNLDIPIIIDGYDPHMAEWLEAVSFTPDEMYTNWQPYAKHLLHQYLTGDFFIVASERQRNWWLGLLENAGRINPWTYTQDPSLRRLLDVVPFGLPENPPLHTRQVIRGVWPGINPQDKIILWGGGLWMWLDPLTAIRAIAKVWKTRQDVRLVFPGTRRPMPGPVQPPTHYEDARYEAERLGLLQKAVFFSEWIDYADWPNVLLESDLALTLHYEETLEAHLAFRARILDCIWAGLPVIATGGDVTGELIQQYQLGDIVRTQDANGLAQKILKILEIPRQVYQQRATLARAQMTWEKAAEPLVQFCRNPQRAPDKEFPKRRIGYPYFLEEPPLVEDNAHLQALVIHTLGERQHYLRQNEELLNLVRAFEKRRIVRFLDWLVNIKRRLGF